jgi:hypothetical protein
MKAQESDLFKLQFDVRMDYIHEQLSGEKVDEASGLKGRYLMFRLDGKISSKFSYSWRQRLNKVASDQNFFDLTDWLQLNYSPTQNWTLSAGKQVVQIGGWEYDANPIDLFFASEFWNNINCFQFGASVTYTTNSGNDALTLQASQSPFDTRADDLYGYNLLWNGKHGCFHALYSLNFLEYAPSSYICYLTLGNRFQVGDLLIDADLHMRGTSAEELAFKNFSAMGQVGYLIAKRVNLFARATYDVNRTSTGAPNLTVLPGTDMTRLGGGLEYYPLGGRGDRSLRLHAAYAYSFGRNGNSAGVVLDQSSYLTVGLTWRIDVIQVTKKLFGRHE